jgi:hypothetical protein
MIINVRGAVVGGPLQLALTNGSMRPNRPLWRALDARRLSRHSSCDRRAPHSAVVRARGVS